MQLTRAYQQDMEYPIISVHLLLLRKKKKKNHHKVYYLKFS